MRADELEPGERFRHPELDMICTALDVEGDGDRVEIRYKAFGARGRWVTSAWRELEDCT